jgi:hypothetical protein
VRGLEAGAAQGGDHRCSAERAALSAFVAVARRGDPVGRPSVFLVAPRAYGVLGAVRHRLVPVTAAPGSPSPVQHLRSMLDAAAG